MMLAILLTFVGSILADNLMVSNIELKADETQNVTINLNNSSKNYVAFQFDVVLPEGITIAKNDSGKLIASLNSDRIDDHSLNVQDLGSGSYRFLCFSMTNAEFYGTSGPLVNITLQADGNISAGKKEGVIKAQVFTETNGNQVKWDDMPFSMTIPDEGSSVVSNLIVSDIELKVGRTQEMAINLNNGTKKYVAFQFDVALPEGITIAKNEKGKLIASLNTDRIDDHTLNVQDLGLGSYRFLCFSMTNAEFYGTSGPLVNLTLEASENLSSGERTATIKNQVFTEVSSDQVKWDDLSFKITTPVPVVPEITADNKSRMYGDENPVFTYTTNETLNGEPELTTNATKTSPVGEYEIVVRKGTLKGDFIAKNGKLTITKVPLTISVGNYEKKQYDPMPEFVVRYEGFKNNETKEVLSKQPTVSCEAKEDSAPGEYAIRVTGAESQNYDIQFVSGKLIVTDPPSYTLTYMVDGKVYQSFSVKYRDAITPLEVPSKEGYTFSGWSEIPATMPAKDVTVTGSFSVNSYTLTYMVDGEVYKTSTVAYGTALTPEATPTKEGNTFSGWSEIPQTMPAKDVAVTGTFSINKYKLTYMVDGVVYKSYEINYATVITPEAEPNKEGYTFSGWSEIPKTMPAKDVVVTGSYTINKYKLTYMVDGVVYKSYEINYASNITPEAEPNKEGYTFSGWSEIPATMPAKDVVVAGSFTINKYKLIYVVDGVEYKSYEINYASSITPEATPTKEGYTFSGWSEIPSTMPANDVVVTGSFTINKYKLIYVVDGVEYKSYEINYASTITPEAVPTKEGYTFSGWSEIPATMPAKDVVVTGSFTINKYKLTYLVNGMEYKSYEINYASTITPEAAPTKEGYTFSGWSEIPESMPAKDVTVTGTFSINSYTLTYMVDGEVYKTSSVPYGSKITPEVEPEKEGYTFSGWSDMPETMPAKDVTVTGTFTINSYTLTYIVDGEEYKSFTVKFREAITPLVAPTKEGYTFSGWDGLPRSMPAKDVVVKGSFTINKYKLTYMVDGVEYKSYEINYATAITPEAEPAKEGYSFSGWSEIPETMPANDVVVTGTFTVNSYIVRFMYRDEVLYTEEVNYGESIPLPELYDDYGLRIKWSDVPETMPAHDIVILVDETDAVLNTQGENKDDIKIYDLNGHRLASPQKGINIIRYSDGTSRKVLIK